jgi:hypothetical protein
MLAHDEGASGPQIAEEMGWAPHTVRGFLAGLARKGIKLEVLDRVRQVGADRQGDKGSYTVYRVAGGLSSLNDTAPHLPRFVILAVTARIPCCIGRGPPCREAHLRVSRRL